MNVRTLISSFYFPLALALAIFLVVRFVLDFNGLYGQDSHEYFRYGESLFASFQSGANPGDYFWPVTFPLYGAILSLIFRDVNVSMQLLSLLAFVGVVIYTARILRIVYSRQDGALFLFVYCFLFLSPLFLRAAFLIMSDMLCVFFITGTFYHFLRYRKASLWIDFTLMAFYASSAAMTRYPAVVVLILPGIITVIQLLARKEFIKIIYGAFIGTVVMLPHFIIKAKNSTDFIFHEFFMDWSPLNVFKSNFVTKGGGAESFQFPNFIYSFYQVIHPGYLFIGILFLSFLRRKQFQTMEAKVICISVLMYALFLGGIPYQNLRYLLLTFPISLVCLYPAFLIGHDFLVRKRLLVPAAAGTIVVQIALFIYVFNIFYQRNQFEKEVFNALEGFPTTTLYTFDLDVALRSYHTKHELVNFLTAEIAFKDKALVLFNDNILGAQWEHTPIRENWKNLKISHGLQQLKEFKNGWTLYEIK